MYWIGGSNESASSRVLTTPPKIKRGIELKTNLSSIVIFQKVKSSLMIVKNRKKQNP